MSLIERQSPSIGRMRVETRDARIAPALTAALLVLATVMTFLPATRFPFVGYDDVRGVARFGIVRQGLSWEGVRFAFAERKIGRAHV